jgi:glucose-6-phosphate 1-dehydrogenase
MKNSFFKWGGICVVGIGFLVFTALCYVRGNYTWIMVALFIGLFLTSTSWKRIRLLIKAVKSLKEGKEKIVVFYRDKNLNESQNEVMPAGADMFNFYGFLPEKNDIKTFRWQGIKRVLKNEKELTKDDILKSLKETSA